MTHSSLTEPESHIMTRPRRLRVVIDRHDNGAITIYADAGVDVFERPRGSALGPLTQFVPHRIPSGWFANPAVGCLRAHDELYTLPMKIIRRH